MKKVGKKFIDSRLLLFLGLFFLYSGCTSRAGHLVGEGGGPYNDDPLNWRCRMGNRISN